MPKVQYRPNPTPPPFVPPAPSYSTNINALCNSQVIGDEREVGVKFEPAVLPEFTMFNLAVGSAYAGGLSRLQYSETEFVNIFFEDTESLPSVGFIEFYNRIEGEDVRVHEAEVSMTYTG